jgi:hypothetical protein
MSKPFSRRPGDFFAGIRNICLVIIENGGAGKNFGVDGGVSRG